MSRFDRRLLTSPKARRGLVAVAICGVIQSLMVIAGASLVAYTVSTFFEHRASLRALQLPLVLFAVVTLLRAGCIWLGEGLGHRTAASMIMELRSRHLGRLARRGPIALGGERSGELAMLLTTGLDALDEYFGRFLPQLGVAVAVPLIATVYIATIDWVSALILAVTVPLVPTFMLIIGSIAERSTRRRWRTFQLLGGHFLDVLQGLPTLRLFGRGPAQVERIRAISRGLRRTTMATLRLAFLSSFALELLASLGTALLAVSIAVRLVGGTLDLRSGLTVLILAPEVYLPLRALGAAFHGSLDGVEAARRLGELTGGGTAQPGMVAAPPLTDVAILLEHVWFSHDGRPALVCDLSSAIAPGERLLVCGPSGVGKSTTLALIVGLVRPRRGRVLVGSVEPASLSLSARAGLIRWLPQNPHVFHGTVADNVRLGVPEATDEDVQQALREVGADFVTALPAGIGAVTGERGLTLSGGQRQRIALARTLLGTAPIVLLDEPLAHLDAGGRRAASAAIEARTRGRTVIIAAHRSEFFPWADRVITLEPQAQWLPAQMAGEPAPA